MSPSSSPANTAISTSLNPPHVVKRITPMSENLEKVSEILIPAFHDDPLAKAFLQVIKNPDARERYRRKIWIHLYVQVLALSGAEMYEVDDYKGVSIWMPPGKDIEMASHPIKLFKFFWPLGWQGFKRVMFEFQSGNHKLQKSIKLGDHWSCMYLAVHPSHQGLGLSKPLMSPHTPLPPSSPYTFAPSHTPHHPIWLEASSPKSHDLYLKMGYLDVGTVRVGQGRVDQVGLEQSEGPGAPSFGMWIEVDRARSIVQGSLIKDEC